jgi:hypothetical protein
MSMTRTISQFIEDINTAKPVGNEVVGIPNPNNIFKVLSQLLELNRFVVEASGKALMLYSASVKE